MRCKSALAHRIPLAEFYFILYNVSIMKTPIPPYQINRILEGRHDSLHRSILGVDITGRKVAPIYRDVYYVNVKHPIGKTLVKMNTPAICVYETGEIYCLYDERIELTETRLVHEFLHRAARRHHLFGYVSGIDVFPKHTEKNEIITEYLTMRVMGEDYFKKVNPGNKYLPKLKLVQDLEERIGIEALVNSYLSGKWSLALTLHI